MEVMEAENVILAQHGASVWKMVMSAIVVVLPGLGSGMTIALTSPLLEYFSNNETSHLEQPLTEEEGSWIVSIPLISMMAGVLASGFLADHFGRKPTLIVSTSLLLLGWLLLYCSNTFFLLLLSRAVGGLVSGISTSCSYMLLSEIALVRYRGIIGNSNTLCLNFAWMASLTLASTVSSFETLIFLSSAPVILFLSLSHKVPESPLWHVKRAELALAEKALLEVRGEDYVCLSELKELMHCVAAAAEKNDVEYLTPSEVAKPIVLLSALFAFQVNSGCEVLSYYSLDIFRRANISMDKYLLSCLLQAAYTVGYMLANPVMTRVGRRTQFVVSGVFTGLSVAAIALCLHYQESASGDAAALLVQFVPPVAAVAACLFYSMGVGPVCFVLLGELFPVRVKAMASSLVLSFRYTVSFLMLKSFPWAVSVAGLPGVFMVGAISCFAGCIVVLLFLPETKGLTLTQLDMLFRKKIDANKQQICC